MNNTGSYDNTPAVADPRDVESWALMQSARDLHLAKNNPEDKKMFRDSIRVNMILWTVFQDSVIDDASALPFEIRQNILNLSIFIDKHSLECLATEDVNELDILISINQNIAAGLAQKPSDQPVDAATGLQDNIQEDASGAENAAIAGTRDIEA